MNYQIIALFVVLLIILVLIKTISTEGLDPALLMHQYEDLYTGEVNFYNKDKVKWDGHKSPIYKPDDFCKKIKRYQEDVDMGPGANGLYGDLIWKTTSPKNVYSVPYQCGDELNKQTPQGTDTCGSKTIYAHV